IGRLDRIGQRSEIHIHVPCPEYSEMHALALVYHEGLNAFLEPVSGADDVLLRFLPELLRIIEKPQQKWDHFTQAVLPAIQAEARALRKELEAGRDRLLEFHSFDQNRAEALRRQVQTIDRQNELERFLLDVLDTWGVDTAEAALSRSWVAHPGLHMRLDSFPGIPDEGLTFTFDRTEGLEREDIVFMSWEHPLALGALDVVTGDQDAGICAVQW
ncbi:MAG: RNA polymerase-associated protein RapA, partial [Deltaproteobacteria bacterium]|nr:RNA polymerase-associated protein RapA [Deltaproteobacteria bacterium]